MSGADGGVLAQLPAFIFYLAAGMVLLLIIGVIEAVAERVAEKREREASRRELREQAWIAIRSSLIAPYDFAEDSNGGI